MLTLNTSGVVAYKVFLHGNGQFVYEEYASKYGSTVIYLPGQLVN